MKDIELEDLENGWTHSMMAAAGTTPSRAEKKQQSHEGVACGTEAVALLNCVAASPFNEDACKELLAKLRKCVKEKASSSITTGCLEAFRMTCLCTSILQVAVIHKLETHTQGPQGERRSARI
jgi:hypothetical protein